MKTIVMTGGSAGLGEVAARRFLATQGHRLIVGGRTPGPPGAEHLNLDLARLDSVHAFAAEVERRLGDAPIDALVLNAGLSCHTGDHRSADGFELTFAVNHLSQYLLLRLLMPRLARGAVVTLTTSATHDPAEKTIMPPPRHADARLLAHPEEDPQRDTSPRAAGGRAYATSKLCGILTARGLARTEEAVHGGWTVLAFDPGPTPGTGLVRSAPLPVRLIWSAFGTPLRALVPRFNDKNKVGEAFAALVLQPSSRPDGGYHVRIQRNQVTWPEPSELARRDDAMEALWHDSAKLVGLPV